MNQPHQPEPRAAAENFATTAGQQLSEASKELATVGKMVGSGQLRLAEDTAHELITTLDRINSAVREMIQRSGEIDVPLRLGDNLVGRAMGERLRAAANGGTAAAIPVLEQFADELDDLETTVRRAAGLYRAADEEAHDTVQRVAREHLHEHDTREGAL